MSVQRMTVAYIPEGEDDEVYIYGAMETDANAGWKYGNDKLEVTKPLPGATGKFADLKLGTLMLRGGQKKTVVVKMNKGLL